MKKFRTDNVKEYFIHCLNSYLELEGIIHESSYVYMI